MDIPWLAPTQIGNSQKRFFFGSVFGSPSFFDGLALKLTKKQG